MSYTIRLEGPEPVACPTCGHCPDQDYVSCPEPTYNLTAIFDLALTDGPLPNPEVSEGAAVVLGAPVDRPRGLRLLAGRKAAETLPELEQALARLGDPAREAEFRGLEPSNGWGSLGGAIMAISKLRSLAAEHPNKTWWVT